MSPRTWLRSWLPPRPRTPARRPRSRPATELLNRRDVPTAVAVPSGLVSRWTANGTAADATGMLGAVLTGRQRYAEAEPLVLKGYESLSTARATEHVGKGRLATAGGWGVRFYEATNQPEKVRACGRSRPTRACPPGSGRPTSGFRARRNYSPIS